MACHFNYCFVIAPSDCLNHNKPNVNSHYLECDNHIPHHERFCNSGAPGGIRLPRRGHLPLSPRRRVFRSRRRASSLVRPVGQNAQQPSRLMFLWLGALLPSRPPLRHIRKAARGPRRTAVPLLASEMIPVPEKEFRMAPAIARPAQQPPRPMFLWSGARRPSRPPQRHLRSRRNQKTFTLALHY